MKLNIWSPLRRSPFDTSLEVGNSQFLLSLWAESEVLTSLLLMNVTEILRARRNISPIPESTTVTDEPHRPQA